MKIKKSIRVLIITLLLLITGLWISKSFLKKDQWLYFKILSIENPDNVFEKPFMGLDGHWSVSFADSLSFAKPEYNDYNWTTTRFLYMPLIKITNDKVWLRKQFRAPAYIPQNKLLLRLSLMNIQAQVFINGKCVADSCFVYHHSICCYIPGGLLQAGKKNTIALRSKTMGTNNVNNIAMFKDEIISVLQPTQSFEGAWLFATGDTMHWKNFTTGDRSFSPIQVPAAWEKQGYSKYDGFAWYRRKFARDPMFTNQTLLLMLGKIDDFHEVFLNSQKLGGYIPAKAALKGTSPWNTLNYYRFNASMLKDSNIIAVRVLDTGGGGGIYEGPLGIIPINNFLDFVFNNHQKQ